MKLIGLGAALAGVIWAGAAMAQDTPPPGCRWQQYSGETTLACKDGRGNWRRSGDDLIVGTYPMPKPKPKPVAAAKPAAKSAVAAATPAAAAAPVAAAPVAKAAENAAQPAIEEAAPAPTIDEAAAPSAADAAVDASAAPAEEAAPPAEPAKTPWWQAIWDAILNFFRSIGLLK